MGVMQDIEEAYNDPHDRHVGTEGECDWCNQRFILAPQNMLRDGFGQWVLNMCDKCKEV